MENIYTGIFENGKEIVEIDKEKLILAHCEWCVQNGYSIFNHLYNKKMLPTNKQMLAKINNSEFNFYKLITTKNKKTNA